MNTSKLFLALVVAGTVAFHFTMSQANGQANIVVIMADDLGYSDIGCYGGEIDTPNLDSLAANGLRFSQFYNTAKCHSSRVSLLTGQYCIAAGDVSLYHAVTSAEVLRDAGYFTAMTGKWHLDREPTDFGFNRYFGHLSGACNFFKGDSSFRLNGAQWNVPAVLNDKTFYTTVADVDFAIDFLGEARKTEKPFYLYVAFNAPHAPLHALPEDYAKYKGRYTEGWDEMRDARIKKQVRLGLLPDTLAPSPRPPHVRAWKDVVPWQRSYETNRMVTLAAMIDRVDQEVGRLVDNLKKHGELDNTLILFVSDNGACPYDRRAPLLDVEPTNGDISLGDSTPWAWARNAPFRLYKQNQFEGGISSPGIVHWPGGLKTKPGSIVDTPAHLIDVLPTLADLAGTSIPREYPRREVRPVSGVSLRPVFEGEKLNRPEPIHLRFSSDYGLRDGDWKVVSFKGQEWELYNVANDRTETNNLAASEPERLAAMVERWKNMSRDILHSATLANPKILPAQSPKSNSQWTVFSDSNEPLLTAPGRKGKPRAVRKPRAGRDSIRARKNTRLEKSADAFQLTFNGDDPGIAMDFRAAPISPAGPYYLTFELTTDLKGQGDIFFTTDKEAVLPRGENMKFQIAGGSQAQEVRLEIDTAEQLYQLRIDVADGPGAATLRKLRLLDSGGNVLIDWNP
ncbi:MAG TPA: arylsulfatase [Acidimicrobiaceae bacterium]|nr:arylsulfatase [Acidimicrobiaceae bacterium]